MTVNIQYLEVKMCTIKAKYIMHVMISSVIFVLNINDGYICALQYRLNILKEKNFSLSCNF